MNYNLYFLNNIHDSMEQVNVEMDPFLDLWNNKCFDEISIKHIILNLANCLELVTKYRLEQEHWTLIFADVNKARYDRYLNGDFISVDIKSGISRLENVCEINHSFSACKQIYQYRNHLMHYTLNGTFEQIIKAVADAMNELVEFIEEEIISELPDTARKDFVDSLNKYKRYIRVLHKLNF